MPTLKEGIPACPGGCLYCMITNIPKRYNEWKKGKTIGINKTLVFINTQPHKLNAVDFSLLDYDFVGYQGINDPFNPVFTKDLPRIVEISENRPIKKLILVTKLPLKDLSVFKGTRKVQIVVSMTGLHSPIERVPIKEKIEFIKRIVNIGLTPLVLIHPYIHTVSDLSFLDSLKFLPIFISYKGFRYSKIMDVWIKRFIENDVLDEYKRNEEKEVLIGENYILDKLSKTGLLNKNVCFRDFIHHYKTYPVYQKECDAKRVVKKLMSIAVVSSSDPANVEKEAIKRRIDTSLSNTLVDKVNA